MSIETLVIEGVSKRFFRKGRESAREFEAVSNVDMSVRAGELVEVVGRSGGGKTTLLNIACGLVNPSDGRVLFEGEDIFKLGDGELSRLRNEKFGVVPQGKAALYSLTVAENVKMAYLMNKQADGADDWAMELLDKLGIADLSECYPSELSGGELRRMSLARALVCSPKALFADEPTGDLDDENTEMVLGVLREAADSGVAVMVVTHEQAAAKYADRMLRMDSGRLFVT